MVKDRRKNSQTYLEERRREQAERRRRLDQVVRQKEKKREVLQKERQARHRAELEQYTEKKRPPLKRKNKIVASRKSSRIHDDSVKFQANFRHKPAESLNKAKNKNKVKNKIKVKSKNKSIRMTAEQAKGLSTLGWIVCGVLAGCLLGGFSYFYFLKPSGSNTYVASPSQQKTASKGQQVAVNLHQAPVTASQSTPVPAKENAAKPESALKESQAAKSATVVKPAAPKFEFYTILPKQQVWSPPPQESQDKNKNKQNQYVLQIASFKNSNDAAQLKQRLEKLKLHPYLSIVKLQSGQQWHRVMLGPFASKRDAEKVRRILQDASIQPGLLKLQQNS